MLFKVGQEFCQPGIKRGPGRASAFRPCWAIGQAADFGHFGCVIIILGAHHYHRILDAGHPAHADGGKQDQWFLVHVRLYLDGPVLSCAVTPIVGVTQRRLFAVVQSLLFFRGSVFRTGHAGGRKGPWLWRNGFPNQKNLIGAIVELFHPHEGRTDPEKREPNMWHPGD